ncbi:hypothetical protein VNO77_43098 [Canavalia gladiata]|uniref:Uncharacterized protein n=1 Tax=Canavalia gladiata TaxID=3824 RepID=A0AAN9JWH0_CANGL
MMSPWATSLPSFSISFPLYLSIYLSISLSAQNLSPSYSCHQVFDPSEDLAGPDYGGGRGVIGSKRIDYVSSGDNGEKESHCSHDCNLGGREKKRQKRSTKYEILFFI